MRTIPSRFQPVKTCRFCFEDGHNVSEDGLECCEALQDFEDVMRGLLEFSYRNSHNNTVKNCFVENMLEYTALYRQIHVYCDIKYPEMGVFEKGTREILEELYEKLYGNAHIIIFECSCKTPDSTNSNSNSHSNSTIECGLCYDTHTLDNMVEFNCGHAQCLPCWNEFFKHFKTESETNIERELHILQCAFCRTEIKELIFENEKIMNTYMNVEKV